MGVSTPSSPTEEVSDETLNRDVIAALAGLKYDSSPLAPPSAASGTVCNGNGKPVCCRILNEYEIFPSAKRLVSGKAENALCSPDQTLVISYIFIPQDQMIMPQIMLTHSHVPPFPRAARSSSARLQVPGRYRNYRRRPLAPISASYVPRREVRNQMYDSAGNDGMGGEEGRHDELG